LPAQSDGRLLTDAIMVFDRADGRIKKKVKATDGIFRIKLPPGRYDVMAYHPQYQDYATGSGLFC